MQVGGRGKGDGVQHEVQPPPLGGNGVKDCFQLAVLFHVQRHLYASLQPLRQWFDKGARLVVEPG